MQPTCPKCNAQLSRYRHPRETLCAPCDKQQTHISEQHAHTHTSTERDFQTYKLRWMGYEWPTIATRVGLATGSSALRSATRYAKRNELKLP